MIAAPHISAALLRVVAPWVWRSTHRIAQKLSGFAATEAGSALDMLKAAELADEPRLRRLFFRHAMDEARHAAWFRQAARDLSSAPLRSSEYLGIHARRQNLFQTMTLPEFVAFVHQAESRGELQFRVLQRHFAQGQLTELEDLFARIAHDERFHIRYSQQLLGELKSKLGASTVRWAAAKVRFKRAWEAWRRAGRILGDVVTHLALGAVYLLVLPPFAWLARRFDQPAVGWQRPQRSLAKLEDARRMY